MCMINQEVWMVKLAAKYVKKIYTYFTCQTCMIAKTLINSCMLCVRNNAPIHGINGNQRNHAAVCCSLPDIAFLYRSYYTCISPVKISTSALPSQYVHPQKNQLNIAQSELMIMQFKILFRWAWNKGYLWNNRHERRFYADNDLTKGFMYLYNKPNICHFRADEKDQHKLQYMMKRHLYW